MIRRVRRLARRAAPPLLAAAFAAGQLLTGADGTAYAFSCGPSGIDLGGIAVGTCLPGGGDITLPADLGPFTSPTITGPTDILQTLLPDMQTLLPDKPRPRPKLPGPKTVIATGVASAAIACALTSCLPPGAPSGPKGGPPKGSKQVATPTTTVTKPTRPTPPRATTPPATKPAPKPTTKPVTKPAPRPRVVTPVNARSKGPKKAAGTRKFSKQQARSRRQHGRSAAQDRQRKAARRKAGAKRAADLLTLAGQAPGVDQSVERGMPPGPFNRRGDRLSRQQRTQDPVVPSTQVHQLRGHSLRSRGERVRQSHAVKHALRRRRR
ncbi:MAG TPA: hypothetical protein VIC57_01180 [Candidatus Dormibacteraeota bacterium]